MVREPQPTSRKKDMLEKSCVEVLFFGTRFSFFYAAIVASMSIVVGIEAVLSFDCVSKSALYLCLKRQSTGHDPMVTLRY
jgi:hypothetical protein